ncbi:DUF3265 domain-containing protein [Vibrio vulnificus]|nr:DUF3265 domain-containing protein [Vibrio vulnificus]ELI3524479.1 DUF3265 domain-containing protein [Vibrio vulnificus]
MTTISCLTTQRVGESEALTLNFENLHNKLFKRDSQRVAFSLCVGLSDEDGIRRLWYCVAHPLTGR